MASAVEALNTGPQKVPYEVLLAALINAQAGFGFVAGVDYRAARARQLEAACGEMSKGLTFGDHAQTMRGYDSGMALVRQLAVEYGLSTHEEAP